MTWVRLLAVFGLACLIGVLLAPRFDIELPTWALPAGLGAFGIGLTALTITTAMAMFGGNAGKRNDR